MVQTFTERMFKAGKKPSGLRDGTKLLSFHYFGDLPRCFVGTTGDGRALTWKKDGHHNGKKNWVTDIVLVEMDPDVSVFYVAVGPNGIPYAHKKLADLDDLKMPVATYWEVQANARTGKAVGERVKIPVQPTKN